VRRDRRLFAVTTNLPPLKLATINGYAERFRETDDHHIHQRSKTASGGGQTLDIGISLEFAHHDVPNSNALGYVSTSHTPAPTTPQPMSATRNGCEVPIGAPRIVAVTDGGAAASLGRPTSKGSARVLAYCKAFAESAAPPPRLLFPKTARRTDAPSESAQDRIETLLTSSIVGSSRLIPRAKKERREV